MSKKEELGCLLDRDRYILNEISKIEKRYDEIGQLNIKMVDQETFMLLVSSTKEHLNLDTGKLKYDYSECVYEGNKNKVTIKCSVHGKFQISPNDHIGGKKGCSKCDINRDINYNVNRNGNLLANANCPITYRKIFEKTKYLIEEGHYSYPEMKNLDQVCEKNIKVKCKDHGMFIIRTNLHITGIGCKKCKK